MTMLLINQTQNSIIWGVRTIQLRGLVKVKWTLPLEGVGAGQKKKKITDVIYDADCFHDFMIDLEAAMDWLLKSAN